MLVTMLSATAAGAAPSAAERDTARHLMDEGKAATKAGDLSRALDAYRKADEIMHVPTTGVAVARTQYALGHLVEAREAALEVIRTPREKGEPAVFEAARRQAREIETEAKDRTPTITIRVRGEPATKVTVDGVEIPRAMLSGPIPVNPGAREVSAKSAEGNVATVEVALSEKDAKEVELELLPGSVARSAGEPRRRVTGPSLEGEPSGPRTPAATVLVYGGFGIAVTGLVVGSVAGALAFSKADDVKPACEDGVCDPSVAGDLDGARTMATVSNVGFAAAAAGAALGIVGLVLPRRAATTASAVYVTPFGGGVRGTF